jgi:hypothetical protein
MSQDQKTLLPPSVSQNIRHNLWVYRTFQNRTRKQLAQGSLRSGILRAYEYGFRPVTPAHLTLLAERLEVSEDALTAPPNYELVLYWQTRRIVEYFRGLDSHQRHAIKRLMMHM